MTRAQALPAALVSFWCAKQHKGFPAQLAWDLAVDDLSYQMDG
jgi:hypothetical protein